jgi:hypothetical protein
MSLLPPAFSPKGVTFMLKFNKRIFFLLNNFGKEGLALGKSNAFQAKAIGWL